MKIELRNTSLKHFISFDNILAILTIPIAIFLIIYEYKTPRAAAIQQVGPEVWPIGILGLWIISAFILFINAIYMNRKSSSSADLPLMQTASTWREKHKHQIVVVMVLLGLVTYGALLEFLCFIICTSLLVIYQARVLERGKWVRNTLVAIIFSVLVYFIFVKLLSVLLPAGLLG